MSIIVFPPALAYRTLRMQKARIALLLVLLLSFGCGSRKEKAEVEAMAVQIHDQLKAGGYKAIYQSFRKETQKVATEAEFVKLMEQLRADFGAFKSAVQDAYVIRYDLNQGRMCILTYDVEFERKRAS